MNGVLRNGMIICIMFVQERLSWTMSLTLSKLDIEVSPFTYALIKPILLCLCGPCCLKNDDRVAVANPTNLFL